jgi:hypothetical protein
MAIRWADSGFNKTAADARQTYQTDGGWWYTTDITSYLNLYGVEFGIISLGAEPADFAGRVKSQLDRNQIIILCLDMDRVRQSGVDQYRADKFYATSPGWGHFIVLKGYRQVDQELFFEAYDPYSFGKTNTDHTLKGEDRYYRFEDLAAGRFLPLITIRFYGTAERVIMYPNLPTGEMVTATLQGGVTDAPASCSSGAVNLRSKELSNPHLQIVLAALN